MELIYFQCYYPKFHSDNAEFYKIPKETTENSWRNFNINNLSVKELDYKLKNIFSSVSVF